MLTKILWDAMVFDEYKDLEREAGKSIIMFFISLSVFLTIFTLPIDLILSPIEIIALIIYFIINRRNNK